MAISTYLWSVLHLLQFSFFGWILAVCVYGCVWRGGSRTERNYSLLCSQFQNLFTVLSSAEQSSLFLLFIFLWSAGIFFLVSEMHVAETGCKLLLSNLGNLSGWFRLATECPLSKPGTLEYAYTISHKGTVPLSSFDSAQMLQELL